MVQVIRTPRQKAFSDVLAEKIGQAAQLGVGAYQQAQQTARQRALQDRQMAMQEAAIERDQLRYEDQQRRQDEALSYKLAQAGVESTGNFEQDMANLSRIGAENRARSSRLARLKEDEANYLAKQRALPYEQRDEYKKAVAVAGFKRAAKSATIPDFMPVSPGIVATPQDKEKLKSLSGATRNILDAGSRLQKKIMEYGITSGTGVTKGDRLVTQDLRDLQMQMKELFNLGVLNGPDLDLLNDALGSIQGPIDLLNPMNTKESAIEQVDNVINSAVTKLKNNARARGFLMDESKFEKKDPYEGFKKEKKLVQTGFSSPNFDPMAPSSETFSPINNAYASEESAMILNPKRAQFRRSRIQELEAREQ